MSLIYARCKTRGFRSIYTEVHHFFYTSLYSCECLSRNAGCPKVGFEVSAENSHIFLNECELYIETPTYVNNPNIS